ncbi:hypothetical protein LCGC14_2577750, partial [marine sediment metagenome]
MKADVAGITCLPDGTRVDDDKRVCFAVLRDLATVAGVTHYRAFSRNAEEDRCKRRIRVEGVITLTLPVDIIVQAVVSKSKTLQHKDGLLQHLAQLCVSKKATAAAAAAADVEATATPASASTVIASLR